MDTVNSYLLPDDETLSRMTIEDHEEELASLLRRQEDYRANGQNKAADNLEARIQEVQGIIEDFEEELGE